jgi:hypothetical protein
MVPNVQPLAVGTLKNGAVVLSAINAGRDGSGTLGTLYVAGTGGALIPRVWARNQGAYGASSPTVCRLFREISGGASRVLIDEVVLPAVTSSATAVGAAIPFPIGNYSLAAGETLKVCQSTADSISYNADQGGDY